MAERSVIPSAPPVPRPGLRRRHLRARPGSRLPSRGGRLDDIESQPACRQCIVGHHNDTELTLALWEQRYERDIGILADDVLVVVDDGKRAQHHVTKAKVKTTVNDCRTWASDAAKARTAAPPIPMAEAEQAWTSMVGTSALGSADCLAALQHGSRRAAKDFQKRVQIMQNDEATLTRDLGGS